MSNQIQVNTIAEAYDFAQKILSAKDFVPSCFKTAEAVTAALLTGKELGLSPMMSLRSLHVVEGKVGVNYDAIIGLLIRNGYTVIWGETDNKNEEAVVSIYKGDCKLITVSYTMQDAKNAGLTVSKHGRVNFAWKNHPASMLRARAVSSAARAAAGDIFSGCYSHDEIEEIRGNQKTPSIKTVKSGKEAARLALGNVKQTVEKDEDVVVEDDVVEDEVDVGELMISIGKCNDMDELNSCAKEIKQLSLSKDSAENLRGAYSVRKEELQQC